MQVSQKRIAELIDRLGGVLETAKHFRVHRSTIFRWAHGKATPKGYDLVRLKLELDRVLKS